MPKGNRTFRRNQDLHDLVRKLSRRGAFTPADLAAAADTAAQPRARSSRGKVSAATSAPRDISEFTDFFAALTRRGIQITGPGDLTFHPAKRKAKPAPSKPQQKPKPRKRAPAPKKEDDAPGREDEPTGNDPGRC